MANFDNGCDYACMNDVTVTTPFFVEYRSFTSLSSLASPLSRKHFGSLDEGCAQNSCFFPALIAYLEPTAIATLVLFIACIQLVRLDGRCSYYTERESEIEWSDKKNRRFSRLSFCSAISPQNKANQCSEALGFEKSVL
ncbi:unnamed protein product [Gongylonema pulchrum]|uniref:Uncharacterized protein n=1 Tax=Gongylonema pulchrum TaxID=637853 RepID=A0A183DVY6_9BILA|nr:unnamed protein product [Gongylonema pulchrum]